MKALLVAESEAWANWEQNTQKQIKL
jgi:hypothetical protein